MKTLFKCEICGSVSETRDDALHCEGTCRLAKNLDKIFGSDEWSPPPLQKFSEWNVGDRKEMANRINSFCIDLFYNNPPPLHRA